MPKRLSPPRRTLLIVELLEQRLVLDRITIALDPILDRFGNQVVTFQAYRDPARTDFSIFDTGSAAITFSASAQAAFTARGLPIPIKVRHGAIAQGVGGTVVGDVSHPDTIIAGGLNSAQFSVDGSGSAQFDIRFGTGSAVVPNIQTFVGTPDSSPLVPTITGTPILNPSPGHSTGYAALIGLTGARIDFSSVVHGFVMNLPDLQFVTPGTSLPSPDGFSGPVRVPLTLTGADNHGDAGNVITESPNPLQSQVAVTGGPNHVTVSGQRFLFDTGSQTTIFSTRLARALGFDLTNPDYHGGMETIGLTVDSPGYLIDGIEMPRNGGTVRFTGVPIFVLDLPDGLDGILGMNLFNRSDALMYDPLGSGGPSFSFNYYTDAQHQGNGGGISAYLHEVLSGLGLSSLSQSISTTDATFARLPLLQFNTAKISGKVFQDFNDNGVADANEPGLGGATVFLDMNNSGVPVPGDPTTVTDQNGFYQFVNLPQGSYVVRVLTSAGYRVTSPAAGYNRTVLESGANIGGVDFGVVSLQTDATSAFLAGLYGNLLDRAPDTYGLNAWTQSLNQGTSREQVARAIWESPEHRALQVDQYYQTYLHRHVDAVGQTAWVAAFRSGATEFDVQRGLLASDEYRQAHRDDAAFIDGVYQDVLGRRPDSFGANAWLQALQNGTTRGQVAQSILTSQEDSLRRLDRYYSEFLHRPIDATGRQIWLGMISRGEKSLEGIGEAILGSPEYYDLSSQRRRA
jgi:hypothetical protein